MLTEVGCRSRRERLRESLSPVLDGMPLVLADPIHLRYLAGFHVDPFSLGGDFGGILAIRSDGHATLHHDDRLPKSVEGAHVDERRVMPWYDGRSPGRGPRRAALLDVVQDNGGRVHDALNDPFAASVIGTIAALRRQKDPDEIALLRECMRITEAGHAWALSNVRAGMSELEIYTQVVKVCCEAAGQAVIVYGDFAVSPGSKRRGGPPTQQVLKQGDTFILDYSVVLFGYRSDFTNTLVVDAPPTPEQDRLHSACLAAMTAGEEELRAGAACRAVYDAVYRAFETRGLAEHFPHHAGHGLGLSHPEAPYFVKHADAVLLVGDVVTLEPGLYVDGVGGFRIEHNYLITPTGFERLSHHQIAAGER